MTANGRTVDDDIWLTVLLKKWNVTDKHVVIGMDVEAWHDVGQKNSYFIQYCVLIKDPTRIIK